MLLTSPQKNEHTELKYPGQMRVTDNEQQGLVLWTCITGFRFNAVQIKGIEKITHTQCPAYRFEIDRTRHLTGQLLAEYGAYHDKILSSKICSISPILQKNGEKPVFANNTGINFNISHSHEIVVCALSAYPVGMDIEYADQDIMSVAEHFFKEDEYAMINRSSDQIEAAYKIWVRKESYLKATGNGIVEISDMPSVVEGGEFVSGIDAFRFHNIDIAAGYQTSVCTNQSVSAVSVNEVDIKSLTRFLGEINE